MTKKELLKKIKLLEPDSEEQKKKMICTLIGHSMIQTTFFGYYYCGRCGDQVGDSLGSYYPQAKDIVIVGHNCETCRENFKKLTWKDKYLAPDPFQVESEIVDIPLTEAQETHNQ